MTLDSLRLLRNILLRSVVVGLAFALFMVVATISGWNTWTQLVSTWFHADQATLTQLVLQFFTEIRFFLVFILLTPGLAIHWTIKREEARKA